MDFAVYFQENALRKETGSQVGGVLDLRLIDVESSKAGTGKLLDNPYTKVSFHFDGERYTIDFGAAALAADPPIAIDGPDATYATLAAAIQRAINTDPTLAALKGKISVEMGSSFTGYDLQRGTSILLKNNGYSSGAGFEGKAGDGWSTVDGTDPLDGGIYHRAVTEDTTPVSELVTSKILLDYVGSGSTGGDLVVGGQSDGYTSNSGGVQEFDIQVQRDSKLEVITSTNNSLREVYIQNFRDEETGAIYTHTYRGDYERDGGSPRLGDLTVLGESGLGRVVPVDSDPAIDRYSGTKALFGYRNGDASVAADQDINIGDDYAQNLGFGFVDVQVIDASKGSRNGTKFDFDFTGKLALSAVLTDRVAAKYLIPDDQASDLAAEDNVQFSYTLGGNDDTFDLSISSANLRAAGAATREDFVLDIAGGAGNDVINTLIHDGGDVTQIANGLNDGDPGYNNFSDWYINAKLNASLAIDAGGGDDTVHAFGSGDWKANLGSGDDTFYSDNTGVTAVNATVSRKATWVFNTAGQSVASGNTADAARQINDLRSDVDNSYAIQNGQLTVSFRHLTTQSNGVTATDVYRSITVSVPAVNGRVTDLQINQAIKTAINTDPVLSKLLVATDGKGSALVVTSLVDGAQNANGIVVNLSSANPADATGIIAFNSKGDYTSRFATDDAANAPISGSDSGHVADNSVEGSAGNDVIVFGTGAFSNDVLVYNGFNNGTDTVVGFSEFVNGRTAVGAAPSAGEQFTLRFDDLVLASSGTAAKLKIGDVAGGLEVTFANTDNVPLIKSADVAFDFFTALGGTLNANGSIATYGVYQITNTLTTTPPANEISTWAVRYNTAGDLTFIRVDPNDGNVAAALGTLTQGNINAGTVTGLAAANLAAAIETADVVKNIAEGTAGTPGQFVWTGINTQHPEHISNYQDGWTAATPGTKAEFTVNFNDGSGTATVAAGTIQFDGASIGYGANIGPIELSKLVAAGNYTNWDTTLLANGQVRFTAKAEGARTLSASDLEIAFGDVLAHAEEKASFTLQFTGVSSNAANESFVFFDKVVTLTNATATAIQQAQAVADLVNSVNCPTALAGWQASTSGTNTVTFTQATGQNYSEADYDDGTTGMAALSGLNTNFAAATGAGGITGVAGFLTVAGDGSTPAEMTQTVTISPSVTAGVFTIFGVEVSVATGDNLGQVATKIANALTGADVFSNAAGNTHALKDWHLEEVNTTTGVITLKADANATKTLVANDFATIAGAASGTASFSANLIGPGFAYVAETGIQAEVAIDALGVDAAPASGTQPVADYGDLNERGDYLDFSSYDVSAVVSGASKSLLARDTASQSTKYVEIDPTATAGVYSFTVYEGGSDGIGSNDVSVGAGLGLIGTVDFGRVIDWNGGAGVLFTDYEGIAGNFIL